MDVISSLKARYERLREDAGHYPDTMEQRFGAWAGLMSLCRLVFDGGGPTARDMGGAHRHAVHGAFRWRRGHDRHGIAVAYD